jgi:hypothetical protein
MKQAHARSRPIHARRQAGKALEVPSPPEPDQPMPNPPGAPGTPSPPPPEPAPGRLGA